MQGTWVKREWTKKQQTNKKRNGLPPAGLADLDPWLWEQTKEQARSGLKDNNTIQRSACKHVSLFTNYLLLVLNPPRLLCTHVDLICHTVQHWFLVCTWNTYKPTYASTVPGMWGAGRRKKVVAFWEHICSLAPSSLREEAYLCITTA